MNAFRRMFAISLIASLFALYLPEEIPLAKAATCNADTPAYVNTDPTYGSDVAGCWGYDKDHPYLTLQAAANDRNSRYTGGSIQGKIYYKDKRAGATEYLRNPTGIPFTIVPYVSNDSIGTRVVLSGQNLTIKNYLFTAGGVNLNNATSTNISIESNSLQGAASVNLRGPSYFGLSYSNNNISVKNNKFNKAELNVDGNNGMTNITGNSFAGTVPGDGDWINVRNTSGNTNITGNSVSGGTSVNTSASTGLVVMSNAHDGNGSAIAYRFSNTGVVSFSNNNIKDSYLGAYFYGTTNPTVKYIENNTINLSDLYSSTATTTGLKTDGVTVESVNDNRFYNSTNGAVFSRSTVSSTSKNSFSQHSTAALTYSGGSAGKIYQNVIDGIGKGIYVTNLGAASEIYGNTITNGTTGILVERTTGSYDAINSGDNRSPSTLTAEGGTFKIYSNILNNLVDSGIALSGVWAKEVKTNFGGDLGSLVRAYNSAIDTFDVNIGIGIQAGEGIMLYETVVTEFNRNSLTDFTTGLEATGNTEFINGVDGLWVNGGLYGIYFENADLNDIVNSIFFNNEYGIYGGVNTYGYTVKNSSFYKQLKSPIYQAAALTGLASMSVQNNAFSRAGDTFVYVSSSGDLITLDHNVYDNSNGVAILGLGTSSYDFDDLFSVGREANGRYQNSGDLFPGANSNVFQLNPSSLAMNSADSSLGISTDFFGTARNMCGVPDMGAVESADDSDLDSDGLCHDQETAFATDENIADTDADLLSDYREIYVHGTDPLDDDTDNDGVTDGRETGSYYTDPLDSDTDDDGLSDGEEINTHGTDADNVDTDGDTFNDYDEVIAGTNPRDALSNPDTVDDDGDGLTNVSEATYGTDPNDSDSDDDGLNDYEEVITYGTDPLDEDTDGDLLADGEELTYGTDPNNYDTDGDTYGDYEEILNLTDPLDASSVPDLTDDDADGLSNTVEGVLGTDPNNSDTDGDALSDYEEFYTYSTDPTLSDTDGDGLSDYAEVITYGTDPLDADMDDDGLDDGDEISLGTDVEVSDSDSDGLSDGDEVNTYGSNPLAADTDSDGLDDADEVAAGSDLNDSDSDDDGLNDADEVLNGTDPNDSDSDDDGLNDYEELNVYSTDPNNSDSDGDTYSDSVETAAGTDPLDALSNPGGLDTDGDGLTLDEETAYGTDPSDADSDDDGLNDYEEIITYLSDPLSGDSDSDTLTDYEEVITYGTDAMNADTDGDLYNDADEISMGTDPLDSTSNPGGLDVDGDGLTFDEETFYGTDPSLADTDSDGLNDYEELITYGTDANSSDSDSDTLNDYAEVVTYGTDPNDSDTDADGYDDANEVTAGSNPLDSTSTPGTLDNDGDGLTYDDEVFYGTSDSDSDSDDDGLEDGDEITAGTDPLNEDTDADGLSDSEEVLTYSTDPLAADSDSDGYDDGEEVAAGSNPNDAASDPTTSLTDTDGDGLTDYEESVYGSDPNDTDSDDDTLGDSDEVNIYNTDPASNDTDGDGFRDDYEISELTDPDDATSMPTLTIYGMGYMELTGLSGDTYDYTDYDTDTLTSGDPVEYEIKTNGYGAFAIRYNTDQYVGTLTVKYCGSSSSNWSSSYSSSSCSEVIDYLEAVYSVGENSTGTSVTTTDQLEVWSYLSSYYTFGDWNWFRTPYTTSSTRYQLFTVEL